MKSLAPVVWREGMHLAQHHFQLRDRYFADSTAFALSSLFFAPYGLTGLELDHDALLNGTVSLLHARGVMPDGLPFSFPDDPPPQALEIREMFSPTRESHVVHLAIPPLRPGRANCALDGMRPDHDTRYVAATRAMPDETTGEDEKPVSVARKNFRLALDTRMPEDLVSLPVARVRRDRSGNFVYDSDYVPPCLQVGASRRILELLRRLIERLEAKADALAAERGGRGAGTDQPAEEVAGFWLSHAIHSSLGPLRHHLELKSSHPAEVFRDLLRLGGALCTFSMESHPRDLPSYDHGDLTEVFGTLERWIRDHLEVVLPRRAMRIPLEPMEESFLRGSVPDPRGFRDSEWFLAVKGAGSRGRLISDVPRLVKVCSAKHIVRLVQSAHPGLVLEHTSSPPGAISRRLGTEYFRITTSGPCWESIVKTGEVGVYAPEAVQETEMEVLIVREE